jgi:hypothetical protein
MNEVAEFLVKLLWGYGLLFLVIPSLIVMGFIVFVIITDRF